MIAERLFTVFDADQSGRINFDEFMVGLASYARGSLDDKLKMLFEMFDLNGEGEVDPEELTVRFLL